METVLIVILVIAALLVVLGAIAAFVVNSDKNRRRVRDDFGPEYHRELARSGGDRSKAQRELEERQKRVSKLHIRELPAQLAQRFRDEWRRIQERFVDTPNESARDADRLVQEVMEARGYPTAEFDERAADVSVDHPEVVENYRRAHQISQTNERGEASTEDLRQALVYYRALFVELLPAEEERAGAAPGANRR